MDESTERRKGNKQRGEREQARSEQGGGALRDVLKCRRGILHSYSNLSAQTCLRAGAPLSTKCEILPTRAHLNEASPCWRLLFCQAPFAAAAVSPPVCATTSRHSAAESL